MARPTILIATWGEGLFAITSGNPTQEITDQPVRGLAGDGKGGALAIVGKHSLQRRSPNGNWATLANSKFELSCCLTARDTIFVGTDDARMLRLRDGELEPIESFDNVEGRETWYAGSAIVDGKRLGPPLGIRSLAANADGSVLLVNVHVGGIPRSLDGGRTWGPTIDVDADVHEVRAHPIDPNIIAAAAAVGLCISRDAGATWVVETEGLHAPHCSAVAFSGDNILVSASTDPFSPDGRIYRGPVMPDGPIVAVEAGMPEWTEGKADTGCIATSGSMVAVVDWGGNLYFSDDFGRTWASERTGLSAPSGVFLIES